jgi:adhesin transport system outer membrane protein
VAYNALKSIFISCTSVVALTFPPAAQAENLEPLLSKLIQTHPRIQAEMEKVQAAEAVKQQAFSGYLPRLDAGASKGRENTDRTALFPPAGNYNLSPTNANLTLTQNLFEGFRTKGSVEAADAGIDQAKAGLEGATQQLTFEAVSSYLNVLKQRKLLELTDSNMHNLQTQLNMEDEKVTRGSGVAVDVLQAKSRLQICKERHTAFTGSLRDAMSNYVQIFGETPLDDLKLPKAPLQHLPKSLEEAIEIATKNSPALQGVIYSTSIAEHQKTVASSGFYPSVDVVASSNYKNDANGITGKESNNSVLLRTNWQLFSGFSDQARVRQATHQFQSARNSELDANRRLTEQVTNAWTNLETSKERADLLDNAVNIAGEVFDARKRLRDAGSDTALNVLDAENELFRAQIDANSARFDYYTAAYRLLMTVGALKLAAL